MINGVTHVNKKTARSGHSRKGFKAWKTFVFLLFIPVLTWCLVAFSRVPAASGAEGRLVQVGVYEPGNLWWTIVVALNFLFLGIIIAQLWFRKKNRELRAANAKLELAEQKYRQLVEDSPDIYFSVNHTGEITFISRAFLKISGYAVEEALGIQVENFYVNPERRRELLTALEKDGYVNDFISELKRKDGSTWWASMDVRVCKDEDGSIMGTRGVARDVTERMEAERRLKKAYAIINQSPAVVFLWRNEPGWPVDYVSENVKNIFGYTAEEFLSGTVSYGDVIHPDDIEKIKEDTAAYQKDYELNLVKQEYRIITKDKRVVWLDHRTFVLRSETGEIIHYQGIVLDITKRKQMEKELVQSENRFRSMMESMTDLVYIGSKDHRLEYMNPALMKRTGRDATGEQCFKVLHDFNEPCPWCIDNSNLEGKAFSTDIISPKDKHSYHFSHSPIVNKDGSISSLMILHDTTERKKLEAQLFQAQKMESIGTLAAGVAHDFNNILTVINGYAQIVQGKVKADRKLKKDVEQIQKAGERAANLTRQLLGFSRKQMIIPKPLEINKLITDMEKMLRRLITEDIRLETVLDDHVDAIYADPGQLEQILMNLTANARDAVREQLDETRKVIRIATSQVFLDEGFANEHEGVVPGWYVQLQVEDRGCGMREKVRKRIFAPFFTNKGVGKGTGMGLATVYGIVKQNLGSIDVYSESGQGTTIKIYWPIMAEEITEPTTAEPDELQAGGSETILLVEDDFHIREITSRQLHEAGYTVLAAENGLKGLEIAIIHRGEIDLLFTDVVMPLMDGKTLYDKIKRIDPEMPVLFGSGYTDDNLPPDLYNLNGDHFINKPYSHKKLLVKIRRLLDEGRS